MKPQDLPRASSVAKDKLEELDIEFHFAGKPGDAPEPPVDIPQSPDAPSAPVLPELPLPEAAAEDIDIPFADLTDIFEF